MIYFYTLLNDKMNKLSIIKYISNMKTNCEEEIKDKKDFLEAKYKERDNLLNNFDNKKYSYFENLEKEIENIEKELKDLQETYNECKNKNNIENKSLIKLNINNDPNDATQLINALITDFNKYSLEIKTYIDKSDINFESKLELKKYLNYIMSKIILLERNYRDLLS